MAISRLGRAGGCTLAFVAACVLSSVSLDASAANYAYGDKGRVRLQLGQTASGSNVPDRFVYEAPNNLGGWIPAPVNAPTQPFGYASKGCTLQWASTTTPLVFLGAIGPGNTDPGQLGLGPTSIGVYNGPQGVACYRVTASQGEALKFSLDPTSIFAKASPLLASIGANAFDRLEFDIEVKKDAVVEVQLAVLGQPTRTYELRTGSSIPPGVTPPPTPPVLTPGNQVYNCGSQSDSGPDAGPLDNCRLIIQDLGQSFTMTARAGEFSLEGGGDWTGDEYNNNSIIYLTHVQSGLLGCQSSNNTVYPEDSSGLSCSIRRISPTAGGSCTTVSYIFRNTGNTCELISHPGEQLVANLRVTYDAEDAPATAPSDSAWLPAPLSHVRFGDDPNSYPVPQCLGVTITPSDSYGPEPIPEIGVQANGFDRIPSTPTIEYACAFERTESYGGSASSPKVTVDEGIQFWGDIAFSRN